MRMTSERFPNEVVGGVSAVAGGTGWTVQAAVDGLNLALLMGNTALVIGGLVLMAPRLWRMFKRR